MKLPNKYGSIYKQSGKRRNPYVVRVTTGWDFIETEGKVRQKRKIIGYYPTRKDALEALAAYHANPYDIDNRRLTIQELYDRWSASYFEQTDPSTHRTIKSAWSYCSSIKDMPVSDVRARHIKGVIDEGYIIVPNGKDKGLKRPASAHMKGRIKSLFNMLLDYAVEYELVDRNYARTFSLSAEVTEEKEKNHKEHRAFTNDELQLLWNNVSMRYVDWILIQCYMGWRPGELCQLRIENVHDTYIQGGMKTKAGRDRIVPIHPLIAPLVAKLKADALTNKHEYLLWDNGHVTYDRYRSRFQAPLTALNIHSHQPHDPRKTFITLCKKHNVDEYAIKRMVGHNISDITEAVYTDRDLTWLFAEISKLK